MHFRQQRRRRVWSDDSAPAAASAEAPTSSISPREPQESYTSHARRDAQPRLTDLIPTRYRTLALVYLAGVGGIGVLEGLYDRLDLLARHLPREALGALDLAGRGSVAAWYSSLLLSLAAATAALLFSLRRHRIDDYRGRYRVWIWGTLGLVGLAINQTSHLGDLARHVVLQLVGSAGLQAPWPWPALCIGTALAALMRMSFEMRRARGSLALLWLGAGAWLLADSSLPKGLASPRAEVMLGAGLKLLGQLTLLAANVAYARYVLLDAHGQLPVRAARPKKERPARLADEEKPATSPAERSAPARPTPGRSDLDPPTLAPRPAASTASAPAGAASAVRTPGNSPAPLKPAAVSVATSSTDGDDAGDDADEMHGLSRAERKRLRRERRQDRRSAA